ncbi:cytochrome P450 [Bradyrhizobium sp. WSM2254]|uniref:cytochrome P450 n=1 Tax=Bradyrhizobium sp. WSM2254 TaxID=1188263 RepID=UPI0004156070|nr:cytochrome P450 [Bradyrhizobium sp. WSM2254]
MQATIGTTSDELFAQIFDADNWARGGIPFEALGRLRETNPIARYERGAVDPFWLVTRHADVELISKDPAQWLNGPRTVLHNSRGAPKRINSLPQMDGAEHAQHRRAIQNWFNPTRIRQLEERARGVAREIVDQMALKGSADIVEELAAPHPLWLMCEILGIPREEHGQVLRLAKALFAPLDPDTGEHRETVMTVEEIFEYSRFVVQRRRAQPSDDLVSAVLAIEADGKPIGEHETLSHLLVLISAGHDTTASAISGGLLALIRHPQALRTLQERPDLMPRAIDEMIRFVTPTTNFVRTAVEDVEIRGIRIAAGDDVCLHYATANRDPRVFRDPDQFQVDRQPNRHLGFGIGPHNCVGQMLAKTEMRTVFAELVPRIKAIALDGEPRWMRAIWISALKTLPVTYELNR